MTRRRKRGILLDLGLNVLLQSITGSDTDEAQLVSDRVRAASTNVTNADDFFADFTRIGEAGKGGEKMLVTGHP